MKKLILFLLCFLFLIVISHAQNGTYVNVGINRSSLNFKESNFLYGFHAGIQRKGDIGVKYFVQYEAMFSAMGSELRDLEDGQQLRYRLNYISTNLLLGYRPSGEYLNLLLGVGSNVLWNATIKFNDEEYDLIGEVPGWDFSVIAGASYTFGTRLNIYGRYTFGVKTIVEDYFTDINGNQLLEDPKGKNRLIQLGLAFRFGK